MLKRRQMFSLVLLFVFSTSAASCRELGELSHSFEGQQVSDLIAPLVDHHQKLLSPAGAEFVNAQWVQVP